MAPTPDQLEAARQARVADLLPAGLRLLFVGINPGLWTAAVGAHFARPGNRFYPALHRAGITRTVIDARDGFRADDLAELAGRGIGITNLCPRPTARADEITGDELRDGAVRLAGLVAEQRPAVVAVLGVTAYRTAFGEPGATVGRRPRPLPGSRHLFVVPNPSGLNAHASLDDLARAYAEAAAAANLPPVGSPPVGSTRRAAPAGAVRSPSRHRGP